MMHAEALRWAGRGITALWVLWLLIWLITARKAKPIAQRPGVGLRAPYRVLIILSIGLLLLASRTRLGRVLATDGPAVAWLYGRFIRLYPGLLLIGAPLVLIGLGVAVWARFCLGSNWSSAVALKHEHELIRTGPYRYVRHPIYTGILLAVAGTACAIGQWRGVVAFALTFIGLWYKAQLEERVLLEHFGEAYRRYQQEVRGLIPFVF